MWINQQFATGSVQIQVKLIAFSNDRHRNLIMWGAQFKKINILHFYCQLRQIINELTSR